MDDLIESHEFVGDCDCKQCALRERDRLREKVREYDKRIVALGCIAMESVPRDSPTKNCAELARVENERLRQQVKTLRIIASYVPSRAYIDATEKAGLDGVTDSPHIIESFRDRCIDLVAFYGGPVDLEAAIRRLPAHPE